jgi:hypothetical protein
MSMNSFPNPKKRKTNRGRQRTWQRRDAYIRFEKANSVFSCHGHSVAESQKQTEASTHDFAGSHRYVDDRDAFAFAEDRDGLAVANPVGLWRDLVEHANDVAVGLRLADFEKKGCRVRHFVSLQRIDDPLNTNPLVEKLRVGTRFVRILSSCQLEGRYDDRLVLCAEVGLLAAPLSANEHDDRHWQQRQGETKAGA